MSREEESNPSSRPGHACIIKTRKIMPRTWYLQELSHITFVPFFFALVTIVDGFCQHHTRTNMFSNLKTNHHVDVGSYNFVDRIGYAVVKMCEIEKSRLFKAEHFPSLNPEPILVRGGGILSE